MMCRHANKARSIKRVWMALMVIGMMLVTTLAASAVRLEGSWPNTDKRVSIDARGMTRSQAIEKLASAAGWSVVVHAPPGDPIDIHVKDQPAEKVLSLLLPDGNYVARRDGNLVSIVRDTADAPKPVDAPSPAASAAAEVATGASTANAPGVPPVVPAASASNVPPTPPIPPPVDTASDDGDDGSDAEDRVVTGGSVKIDTNEVVKDVVVFGGSVDVYGKVLGDVVVTGGSVRVRSGAHVRGDVTTVGGALDVEDGARVDGDVGVVGGVLRKAEGAQVGGVRKAGKQGRHGEHVVVSAQRPSKASKQDQQTGLSVAQVAKEAGEAVTKNALLFVLGAVLIALATQRMESLQLEVAARPMRTFALGIVGSLAAVLVSAALVITVVGIPVVVVCAVLGTLAVYGSICAVLATVGGALVGHRTKNPYVHLAVGCALLLLVGSIPYVGGIVTAVVVLIGIGSLVATRLAGYIRPLGGNKDQGPYRTASAA